MIAVRKKAGAPLDAPPWRLHTPIHERRDRRHRHRQDPTAAQRATYERLMAVNERGLTPSALERHKRAWKKLAESLAARGCTLADL